MPYKTLAAAKAAKFPVSSDKTPLTLSQVNKLAEIYDAIKAAGTTEVPMAAAWTTWKGIYEKQDNKWVLKKKVESQTVVSGGITFDPNNIQKEWVPVAAVGQEGLVSPSNQKIIYTEEALKNSVATWKGGDISFNHDPNRIWSGESILDAKFEDPYLYMLLSEAVRAKLKDESISGCSIEGVPGEIKTNDENAELDYVNGSKLTLMELPLLPACKLEDGCGVVASSLQGQMDITTNTGVEIETTVSSQAVAVAEDSTRAFDTYVINNAGIIVKIGTDTVYGSKKQLKDPEYIKMELMQRGSYYGRDNLQFYDKDELMKLGDTLPAGKSPVHVMTVVISKENKKVEQSNNPRISEKTEDEEIKKVESSRGGDVKGMGDMEPVTFTGDQVKEMVTSAVGEVEKNLKNQQEVDIAALKDNEIKAKEELETKHTAELKEAEEKAFKKAGVIAAFKAKFNPSEEVLIQAEELDPGAIEFFNELNIPVQGSASGVTSAKPDREEKPKETVKEIKTRFDKKLGRGVVEE